MKTLLKICVALWLISTQAVVAQAPEWDVAPKGNYKWMTVHQSGMLLVYTSEGLQGIDPETHKVEWTLPDLPIKDADDLLDVENTPFIKIEKDSKIPGQDQTLVIDVTRGLILFDSKVAKMKRIDVIEILASINKLYIKGKVGKQYFAKLIDLEDGKSVWEIDLTGVKPKFLENIMGERGQGDVPVADKYGNILVNMSALGKLFYLDGKTGQTLWEKEGSMSFISPKADKVYMFNEIVGAKKKGFMAGRDRSYFMTAYDIKTSNEVWKTEKADHSFQLNYEKGVMLAGRGSLQLIDYENGKILQEYKIEELDEIKYFRYIGEGLLIAAKGRSGEKVKTLLGTSQGGAEGVHLYFFDKQGGLKWKSPILQGEFYNFEPVGVSHVFLMTTSYFNIYSMASGQAVHQVPLLFVSKLDKNKNEVPAERMALASPLTDFVMVYTEDKIYKIGTTNNVTREHKPVINKVKFKGGGNEDVPNSLETLENGNFLLSNPQNLLSFDQNGSIIYQEYYPKPGRFGRFMGRFALSFGKTLLRVAIAYILINDAMNNGLISQTLDKINSITQRTARVGVGFQIDLSTFSVNMNLSLNNRYARGYTSIPLNPKVSKSYKGMEMRNESLMTAKQPYKYIFSKSEDKVEGLLKISTADNKTLSFVRFDDKSPDYEIDNFNGNLYFVNEQGAINTFALNNKN